MLRELARELAVADVSDAVLVAYVDGELDEAERVRVAAVLASDAGLRSQADRLRASRERVRVAFDEVLREPVPQHLIDFIHHGSSSAGTVSSVATATARPVVAFEARSGRRSEQRPALFAPFRMAAGVALLLLAGAGGWLLHPLLSGEGVARSNDPLQAAMWARTLNAALDRVPSGDGLAIGAPERGGGTVKVVSTFRTQDQRYCRQYAIELQPKGQLDGLACRTPHGEWLVEQQARRIAQSDAPSGLRPASGRARQGIDATVDSLIEGGVLDASEEHHLIQSGWTAKLPQR